MRRIRFLGPDTDAYVASVARHAAEFEEASGIGLHVTIVPSDLYFSNRIHHLLDGDEPSDVYMSGPVLVWEHLAAGFVRPLDDLVPDTSDFFESLLHCNRWSGRFGDPLGSGPLLELPVNCEAYNLAYVPAMLERAGVEVPDTWDAYLEAARTIARRSDARGFAQRGTGAWHTMYTGFATQLWSCGGRDFEAGRCAIASPAAVEVTEAFLAALREAGPEDWPEQRWYELALDFGRGRYGLIVDSDHYVAYFEDPVVSPLAGEIAYAPPPAGPAGRRSNLWTWSIVVNTRARDLDSVRRFVEWACGRPFLLRSAFEGNMNPTRRSIWDDEQFRAHTAGWGAFYEVARNLIERDASVLVTPAANYLEIATRWVAALRAAYLSGDASGELEAAAADIDRLL
jgi:multiple sugar transport system substrate-binding protein